jgi:hypothetical protein
MFDELSDIDLSAPYYVIEKDSRGALINEVNRAIAQHQCVPVGGVSVVIDKEGQPRFFRAVLLHRD